MKKIFAIATGLLLSVASTSAWADVASPCGCGTRSSGPGGGGSEGGSGGTAGTAGTAGAAAGGTGGGTTTTTTMKSLTPSSGNALACTEAAVASTPTLELAAGMGLFFLLPFTRRRKKKPTPPASSDDT